jgi:hypothetical protein
MTNNRSIRISHGSSTAIDTTQLRREIRSFYGAITSRPHHRDRSWEHCFQYFYKLTPADIAKDRDYAALQLGFYLASWGMYRGSSFLLQHTYTIHLEVIDQLAAPQFSVLWEREFGATDDDLQLVPLILEVINAIRTAYAPFTRRPASTILVTKILLGAFGCLPACDEYFVKGFRNAGFSFSDVNSSFMERVLRFCRENIEVLRDEQRQIQETFGIHYPLMKLVDMYFWQIGGGNSTSIIDE